MLINTFKKTTIPFALLSAITMTANAYDMSDNSVKPDIDWKQVPVIEKTLFFPGLITYDWINSSEHRGTQREDFESKTCTNCHQGEEKGLGEQLVKHDRLDRMIDKPAYIDAKFQFANDDEYLYIKSTWATQSPAPARMHDTILYKNGKWTRIGGDRGKNPYSPIYEDRFSIMIDDGKVDKFTQQGCWMSCHQGMRDIGPATSRDVKALDVIGTGGLNKSDIRKYLPDTRTEPYGINWDKVRTREEIDQLKAEGKFVDLMQWRSTRSAPVNSADDGYVLEYRLFDSGKNVFAWNFDRKKGEPKYMYDKSVTGFYALNKEDFNDLSKRIAMVEGVNTMPYDPSKIKEGQYLQGRVNRVGEGSAGDNNEIHSEWIDGKYTVIFKRKLDTGQPDDKTMQVGGTYDFNIAIHDGQTTTRYHYTTFPFTVGIGEKARGDVISVTIK